MKILFTGGGTAGHIFPIIAVVREIKKVYPGGNIRFFYVGPEDEFGSKFLSDEGIKVKTILAGKIRRYFSWQNFVDIFIKIPIGFLQAFFCVFLIFPDLIFSKGGYGSLSVVISGKILLTPIFLHESDISPGLANKIASKISTEIFTAFPVEKIRNLPLKKLISVGNPLRSEVLEGSKEEAKKIFKLTREKPIILVLGGSQGAQKINDTILEVLPEILEEFELIHQTGGKNFKGVEAEAQVVMKEQIKRFYHPVPFLDEKELAHAYQTCDLVVSRAGAGTIFEIAAKGKPSILIPLAGSAQNHQVNNAYTFAETGASLVIEESNLTPHFFLERLKYLFSRPEDKRNMAISSKNFSKPRAANIIANYIVEYLIK